MAQLHALSPQENYKALTPETVASYLAQFPDLVVRLGPASKLWQVREVGDGNLNLVFIVSGPNGTLCLKQALPYVRLVGESWPLPLSRALFEYAALKEHTKYAPSFVPKLHHHDAPMALTVMEYLSPHIILRKGLIQGTIYPNVAKDLGTFMAKMLYHTSTLHLSAADKRANMTLFSNNDALCKITEDLVFDEPYFDASLNRHTPDLDDIASTFQKDVSLKKAVQEMKWRFLNNTEALLHGDLHSGSVMVTESETKVIDPEFAFYGPMGFDIGQVIGNFLLAAFAQAGQEEQAGARRDYTSWILEQIIIIWDSFVASFTQDWRQRTLANTEGDAYMPRIDPSHENIPHRLEAIWGETVGFAGVEIIRRILGLAHVEDFESIADTKKRAVCERQALNFARSLLVEPNAFSSVHALVEKAFS